MKFMVELRLKPGNKNKIVDAFELRGPSRNRDVTFQAAWVGTNSDVVFALVESASEAQVAAAGKSWSEFGDYQIHPVIDVQQY
jgi:hypothetical protein